MFTGLIREIGTIRGLQQAGGAVRLEISAPVCAGGLGIGDSLAVNGICLTVTQTRGPLVSVEAATETRRVTTLARWRAGDAVHLEPALRMGDPLGGHLVLGHVDGTGRILSRRTSGGSWFMTVGLERRLARFLLPKGSVAVDGVSLTVDEGPFFDRFTVNLIRHTLKQTCLDRRRVGDRVNLEMDVLVKAARGEGLAGELLAAFEAPSAPVQQPRASAPPAPGGPLTLARLLARGFSRGRSTGSRDGER